MNGAGLAKVTFSTFSELTSVTGICFATCFRNPKLITWQALLHWCSANGRFSPLSSLGSVPACSLHLQLALRLPLTASCATRSGVLSKGKLVGHTQLKQGRVSGQIFQGAGLQKTKGYLDLATVQNDACPTHATLISRTILIMNLRRSTLYFLLYLAWHATLRAF